MMEAERIFVGILATIFRLKVSTLMRHLGLATKDYTFSGVRSDQAMDLSKRLAVEVEFI